MLSRSRKRNKVQAKGRKGPDRERVLRRMTEPNSHAGARSAEPRFRQEPACNARVPRSTRLTSLTSAESHSHSSSARSCVLSQITRTILTGARMGARLKVK
eukprot:scaffold5965_cov69-Phaeocystis_antarctica.AAC.4